MNAKALKKKTMSTHIWPAAMLLLAVAALTGCDTRGEGPLQQAYYEPKYEMVFNADPDQSYTFLVNGDTLPTASENRREKMVFIEASAPKVAFVARNNATGKDEISQTVDLTTLPLDKYGYPVFKMVKFAGQPLEYLSDIIPDGVANPLDKDHTKCAFLYNNAALPNKMRVYLRVAGAKQVFDTLLVTKGELSTFSKNLEQNTSYNYYLFQKKDENLSDADNSNWKPVPGFSVRQLPIDKTGVYRFQVINIESINKMTFLFGIKW